MPREKQFVYWLCTLPHHTWTPWLSEDLSFCAGQLEEGKETGYLHWQVLFCFSKKVTVWHLRRNYPGGWYGPSDAKKFKKALEYVHKQDTAVAGTQFELGELPFSRNSKRDWDVIREAAISGAFDRIPAQVFVCHYAAIRRIASDHAKPVGMERTCTVFWGPTGTGKSRRAWSEASLDAYPKVRILLTLERPYKVVVWV